MNSLIKRKPSWLRQSNSCQAQYGQVSSLLQEGDLHTICQSGRCPNRNECWSLGTATFMIAGERCTRACKFCNTQTAKPMPVDEKEPQKLASAVRRLNLKYAVITSVTRDDLHDEGLAHWINCIEKVKEINPSVHIEILIPDFHANKDAIAQLTATPVKIIGHNIETVERLTPQVRHVATYRSSLSVLKMISELGKPCKSGLMLGFGETDDEVRQTLVDLREAGCEYLTIGQYLQPSKAHFPVQKYYTPQEFEAFRDIALSFGFKHVESGPFVRSSYHASAALESAQ